jgi:hypothetical protein
MNHVDPLAWLADVSARIATYPAQRLERTADEDQMAMRVKPWRQADQKPGRLGRDGSRPKARASPGATRPMPEREKAKRRLTDKTVAFFLPIDQIFWPNGCLKLERGEAEDVLASDAWSQQADDKP